MNVEVCTIEDSRAFSGTRIDCNQMRFFQVTNDDKVPKQMCIECYNIFTKMTLFTQICRRSKRALANICKFTAKQQSNTKIEDDDLDILYDVSPEIVEIKVKR